MNDALRHSLSWPIMKRSLAITVIAGSLLNLINQGEALWAEADVDWLTLVLTYAVPFCVSTFGAYSVYASRDGSGNEWPMP